MKSNTQLRQKSIKKVLNEIRIRGPLAKRELQEITGFSWGNISSITTELFNDNYITASGKIETYVGRRPEAFDINENDNLIIGIDFSTKGVLAVLCDLRGRVILKTEKLFVKREKAEAFDTLYASVDEILEGAQKRKILYIAIAMQGDVDSENGVSIKIRKIADWRNIPVCSILEEKYGIKSVMFHDPDCILHTEKYYGVLSDSTVSNALLLSITNHGIGIAALLSGKIYMGNGGKTCEIGNMVIPNSESNKSEFLQDMFTYDWINKHSGGAGATVVDISQKAREGSIGAVKTFELLGDALGVALNNASYLFNPQKIILFGSFCKHSDLFLEKTKSKLFELMGDDAPEVAISKFDDTAAAIGATLFAADLFVKEFEF